MITQVFNIMFEELGFIKVSQNRPKILISLLEGPKTPTQISDDVKIHRNNVSNYLNGLQKRGIIECINPEVKKGKLYRITPKGNEIIEKYNLFG